MIAPLPPQPGLPQPADQAVAKPDLPSDSDSFAEILAAAAAALPAAPRVPGPPPALEHGPAVMRIADIAPAEPVEPARADLQAAAEPPALAPVQAPLQAGLTDPAAEIETPHSDQPQPAARVFNQDGFFGTRIDAPAMPGPRIVPGTVSAAAPLDSDTPAFEAGIAVQPASAGLDSHAAPVAAAPAEAGQRSPLQPTSRASGLLTGSGVARPIAFEDGISAEEAKPATRRAAFREPARATIQVAMRELEQGVHVAARAEGLDAAERVRLHDEITALLARHGLSARSIRISAPGRARTLEEKLK
jgi:hypothetical protein